MAERYLVVIEETANGFSAYSPDLPGCVAAGDSESETVTLMNEAVRLYCESLLETAEIIADTDFMAELKQSIRQADAGELIPEEEVERKYGVESD